MSQPDTGPIMDERGGSARKGYPFNFRLKAYKRVGISRVEV